MKLIKFLKEQDWMDIMLFILVVLEVVVFAPWSYVIIRDRDNTADVTPGDVVIETTLYCENNEPEDVT